MSVLLLGVAVGVWSCYGIEAIRKALRPAPKVKPAARHARLPDDFEQGCTTRATVLDSKPLTTYVLRVARLL